MLLPVLLVPDGGFVALGFGLPVAPMKGRPVGPKRSPAGKPPLKNINEDRWSFSVCFQDFLMRRTLGKDSEQRFVNVEDLNEN